MPPERRPMPPRAAWNYSATPVVVALRNRVLQLIALYAPGAYSLRPRLHRLRGVRIGPRTFIGMDVILETDRPHLVSIGANVDLSVRVTVIAHFAGTTAADATGDESVTSVRIEDDVFVGPGAIILPNVTIGRGAVVTAGSVVTKSVPPLTMVQGNPAEPVARSSVPLMGTKNPREYYRTLRPIRR
ncbi:MAG: acyltransferase [Thermoleophilia bacterium]|nr:acyltransferase [Thermoleophilia bacterium]